MKVALTDNCQVRRAEVASMVYDEVRVGDHRIVVRLASYSFKADIFNGKGKRVHWMMRRSPVAVLVSAKKWIAETKRNR
jgi:hypothetical protein